MIEDQWHDVTRIVHLVGGQRAISKVGSEVVIPLGNNRTVIKFSIDRYHDLPSDLISLGFKIVGIEYYEVPQQVQGYLPAMWLPSFHAAQKGKNLALETENIWSNLAHAAFKEENIELMDICSRISFEVKACNLRLKQLSNAYYVELRAFCEQNSFSLGKIKTLNSYSIYLETHDLLRELCTLRDYLAEFVANFVLSNLLQPENRIRLMNSLRKQITKDSLLDHSIASEILDITNEGAGGWLAKLSAYRDLVVHYVPLEQAQNGFILRRFLPDSLLGDLPSIHFPIPSDPFSVKKERSKGSPFNTVAEWLKTSRQDDDSAPDALEYCLRSVGEMMAFASRLAKESPISPEIPTFTMGVDSEKIVE
jgi:hypothetical protein